MATAECHQKIRHLRERIKTYVCLYHFHNQKDTRQNTFGNRFCVKKVDENASIDTSLVLISFLRPILNLSYEFTICRLLSKLVNSLIFHLCFLNVTIQLNRLFIEYYLVCELIFYVFRLSTRTRFYKLKFHHPINPARLRFQIYIPLNIEHFSKLSNK